MADKPYGGSPQELTNHLKGHLDEAVDAGRIGDIAEYVRQLATVRSECTDMMRLAARLVRDHGMEEARETFMETALDYDRRAS